MWDEDDASKPDNLSWYYLTRGHLISVQEAAIVRHEIPVIISFRWLKRHDGNEDFLGYGCLLQITNDTPRRLILYRIVHNLSVWHSFSSYSLGLGALSGYLCPVLGLWNLGEKRFPSSNNIRLFPRNWRIVFHSPRWRLVIQSEFMVFFQFQLLNCWYVCMYIGTGCTVKIYPSKNVFINLRPGGGHFGPPVVFRV